MSITAIILKIEPGQKRSNLVYALSPTVGKMLFVYYDKSSFVVPGPFRVLNLVLDQPIDKLTLRKDSTRLPVLNDADVLHHYDQLSNDYEQLTRACDLGLMALDLSVYEHENQSLFTTLLNALEAVGEGADYFPWRVCLLINFLNDFGSMPPDDEWNESQKKVFNAIYETSQDRKSLPKLSKEKWMELEHWSLEMIDWAGIRTEHL